LETAVVPHSRDFLHLADRLGCSGDRTVFGWLSPSMHPTVAAFVSAIGWALPAFSEFDIKSQVVHGLPVALGLVAAMVGYAVIYAASAVALSVALFSRREFK